MLGSFRVITLRCFAYSEHGCAVAFAGLEFTDKIHLLLTVCSVVLLTALILIAADCAVVKVKGKVNGNPDTR